VTTVSYDGRRSPEATTGVKSRANRLVLGMAGAVDYEITWDASVLEELVRRYDVRRDDLGRGHPIRTERDLVVAILSSLRDGVGGEWYVASTTVVEQFATRFAKRITLGGTPVRAALAMRTLGLTGLLHLVAVDDHVRRLLPQGWSYLCSARDDSTHPHLIVQFPDGAHVRSGDLDLVAPTSNRLIFANDPPVEELVISEELGDALSRATFFLISGFNVIRDPAVLDRRLQDLRRHMLRLPVSALVYYEEAGFHAPGLDRRVRDALRGAVDVHGMNEEEMQGYVGRSVDLLDPADVERALAELAAAIPGATLVVHSKHWALAAGTDAWRYADALHGGITMATSRYLRGDGFSESDYQAVHGLPPYPEHVDFADALNARMGESVCCLPAIRIHVTEPTTVGLGDTFVGGFIAEIARVGAR
jgi:ADP-dependent phosphofructokinase/glucokinase